MHFLNEFVPSFFDSQNTQAASYLLKFDFLLNQYLQAVNGIEAIFSYMVSNIISWFYEKQSTFALQQENMFFCRCVSIAPENYKIMQLLFKSPSCINLLPPRLTVQWISLKYSWTPLCQTRLSPTPRYLELYYIPKKLWSKSVRKCSQGTSWQDVLKAEKCIDVFTVMKAKSDWLDLPLQIQKATSCQYLLILGIKLLPQ